MRPARACLRDPPPFSRFSHRRAGFRRAFARDPLSRSELDPASTCFSPMDLPSRASPGDFCNRDEPRAQPRDLPNPAHLTGGRPRARLTRVELFRALLVSSWVTLPLSRGSAEVPPARGGARFASPQIPRRSLTAGLLPRPTSLGHLLSPTWCNVGLEGRRRVRDALLPDPPGDHRFHGNRRKGRLSPSPAKRLAIRRTRGAFGRQMSPTGTDRPPQVVPNLWRIESTPFLPPCLGAF